MRDVIASRRLRLVTFDVEFLRASLAGDRETAAALLGMALPESWPDDPDVLRLRLEPFRRQGYAFEATRALIAWAANEHAAREFVLSIAPHNEPSANLARKLGFARFGQRRHEQRGFEDVYRLSLRDSSDAVPSGPFSPAS